MTKRTRRAAPRHRASRSAKPNRRNPRLLSGAERKLLETARRLSKRFHGTPAAVVELAPNERQGGRSRFAAVLGEVASMSYEPPRASKRGGQRWQHEMGDRGSGRPTASNRPLLAVDPRTRRPFLIFGRSPLRVSSARGLVG